MQGALDLAEANLRYCTILSPIDGTVVARNVTVGQSVAASLQAPVVFSIAQDLRHMQLAAATDESDTGNIKIGTEATFQVDAFPMETFSGRVSAIRLNATMIQNVVTYSTIINFDNLDGRLLPGETAYATIPTGHVDDTVKIPNAALRYSPPISASQLADVYKKYNIPPEARSGRPGAMRVVWFQNEQRQIQPVSLRAGITDYTFTQMVDGNLKLGQMLITGQEGGVTEKLSAGSGSSPPRFGAPPR
jgi:HlyD family secretion protein